MYCQRNSNNSINRIHERAVRIAYNDYTSSFKGLLEKDNSVTIHQRSIRALALEIFKTKHNSNPSFMKDIFCPVKQTHNTRNHNLAYSKTVTYGLETFGYKASHIWNDLPKEIQSAENIKTFESLLYHHKPNLCTCNPCRPLSQTLDISK